MHATHLCLVFFSTCALLFIFRALAPYVHLTDFPSHRKKHLEPVPIVGGIAIFLSLCLATLWLPIERSQDFDIWIAAWLTIFIGVLDDRYELSPKHKALGQCFIALCVTLHHDDWLVQLGNLFALGNIHLALTAWIFTLFCIIGVMNAINMLDGLDGLAGSVCFIQFLGFFLLASHHPYIQDICALLMTSIFAFLIFNWPRKQETHALRIFLGDAGSLLLGLFSAWIAIHLTQSTHDALKPVTMLWVIALPLWEALSSITRRLRQRQSPFYPDRLHLHYLLLKRGFSPKAVVCLSAAVSLLCIGCAFLIETYRVPESQAMLAFLSGLGIFVWVQSRLISSGDSV